jgi:hypothetical protein
LVVETTAHGWFRPRQIHVFGQANMSAPDKHHYLPVFYFNQWAMPDGKVIRYHRPVNGVVTHPIAPKNTGYERGLYRLDGYAAEQRDALETSFMSAVVDNEGAQAMQVLIARDLPMMTPELRRAWVRFIMALHVRHPARVEQITEQAAEFTRQSLMSNPEEYEAVHRADDPPTLLAYVEQKIPALIANRGKQLLPGIITHEAIGDTAGSFGAVCTSEPVMVCSRTARSE